MYGDEEPEKSGPVRKVDGEVQQSVSQVSEIGERPRPNLWEFRQRALNLQQGDEESERDVLCQDRQAKRRRAAFHVLTSVLATGDRLRPGERPATTTSATRHTGRLRKTAQDRHG